MLPTLRPSNRIAPSAGSYRRTLFRVCTACIWGQLAILEWLISQGADLTQSAQGLTSLEIAQNQAQDGRPHRPIVTDERMAEIDRHCATIAARLLAVKNEN